MLQLLLHDTPLRPMYGAGQQLRTGFPHLPLQLLCCCIGMRPQDMCDEEVDGFAAEYLAAGAVLVQQD